MAHLIASLLAAFGIMSGPADNPGRVVVIPEGYEYVVNVMGGDTLTLIMAPGEGVAERCADAGGTFEFESDTWLYLCKGVDF